jgi:hypothetical protein
MRSADSEHGHAEHRMHISHEMPPTTADAHMGHDRHAGHSLAGLATPLPLFLPPNISLPFLARLFSCMAEACLFAGLGENSPTADRG